MWISRSQTRGCSWSAASDWADGPGDACCCWCLLSSLARCTDPCDSRCWCCCCSARCPSVAGSCTRSGAPATSPSGTGTARGDPSAAIWCRRSAPPASPTRAWAGWCIRASWDGTWWPQFCCARGAAFFDPRLRALTDSGREKKLIKKIYEFMSWLVALIIFILPRACPLKTSTLSPRRTTWCHPSWSGSRRARPPPSPVSAASESLEWRRFEKWAMRRWSRGFSAAEAGSRHHKSCFRCSFVCFESKASHPLW